METFKLRDLIAMAAFTSGGRIWPNGLAFDCRGWSYGIDERADTLTWWATTGLLHTSDHFQAGKGSTPHEARKAATWQERAS